MVSLLNFIFPTNCSGCRKKGDPACRNCLGAFEATSVSECQFPLSALGEFDGPVERIITDFKDKSLVELARPLSMVLRNHFIQLNLNRDVVVSYPPANRQNYRKRGFEPTGLVLKKALRGMKNPIIRLRHTRRVADQRGLSAQQRAINLSHAMSASSLEGKQVFLFDDVMTTGATINEMARAIRAAGGEVIAGCVLAQRKIVFSHIDDL